MPRDKAHPAQLGSVRNHQGKLVARLQPQEFGQARDFSGPRRDMERRAIEDVLAIRAAGEEHRTRMGALQAMKQEAARLDLYINIFLHRGETRNLKNRAPRQGALSGLRAVRLKIDKIARSGC